MQVRVQWVLDSEEEGGKWFLSHLFFQKEVDGMISIGLMKRNGDDYAYAVLTKQELLSTIKALGLLEEDDDASPKT